MAFHTFEFTLFFIVFFYLYWLVFNSNVKLQNAFILTGSYVFYAYWDWRLLSILIASSALYYLLGKLIYNHFDSTKRLLFLIISILPGLSVLLLFKYYEYFKPSLLEMLSTFKISLQENSVNIVLPLGISFYTFRNLSYIFDLSRKKITPAENWVTYFTYVAFFPTLAAGPIDKSRDFIPQLEKSRSFDYNLAIDGLRQILWGLFKKIVIADNCANITNKIFENIDSVSSSTLLLGSFFFIIQLYADFSGYSDMAIGISKLVGFKITKNFNYPFYANNISDFWQRWHISLTSWMTEYVYTPLAFILRDLGKFGLILSILITFSLIGIWHGSSLTFLIFGLLHGLYFVPLIIRGKSFTYKSRQNIKMIPSFFEFLKMIGVFVLIMITAIVFRSSDISQAFQYIKGIFSFSLFAIPNFFGGKTIIVMIFIMLFIEWLQRDEDHALTFTHVKFPKSIRWSIYYTVILLILLFGGIQEEFIYIKF